MYKSGIYLWVNKITGKVYIGQANDLDRRRKDFYNFNRHYGGI